MSRPRALHLFSGADGTGHGLFLAGFDVTSVDVHKRQHLPGTTHFVKGDALEVLADLAFVWSFDLVFAGPPCQPSSRTKHLRDAQGKTTKKQEMVPQTRALLEAAQVPYVIENVEGAPIRNDVTLCGAMFPELAVMDDTGRRWLKRHRVFELGGWSIPAKPECCTCVYGCDKPTCKHRAAGTRALGVYASKSDNIPSGGQTARSLDEGRALMGMPWASWAGLVEAIPPVYSQWLGKAFLERRATGNPAQALQQITTERKNLEVQAAAYVQQMLDDGSSWARIGDALGVTKQAAQQRYGKRSNP